MVAVAPNAAEPASPKMAQTASFTLCAAAAAKSLQSCPTLCDPIDGSTQGSPVPGILQGRTLEWGAFPSPMHESECEVAQSCPTLSDPMDCSLPGSYVHGVFQARVLEWGAIAFSKMGLYQTKKIPHTREIINQMERQPTERGKILANHISDQS